MQKSVEVSGDTQRYIRSFEHIGEVTALAQQSLRAKDSNDRSSQNSGSEFSGTHNLEEAIDLLQFGWPEGMAAARDLLSKIDLDEMTQQFQERFTQTTYYDLAGDEADVGRYLDGDPESMRNIVVVPQKVGSIVKILINLSQHYNVSADRMRRRGVVALGAVEALHRLGYSVDLHGYELSTPSGDSASSTKYEAYIPLLSPGSITNLDTISFAIAHPSFLRRIIFAVEEEEPEEIRDLFGFHSSEGYGIPHDLKPSQYKDPNVIHIGKDEALCKKDKDMPKELKRLLDKLFSQQAKLESAR
ncbi:MAG TPA: hypothetical protein VD947_04155 [Patescibacteria group bacterium]|nr:hypothetical protein [Patescibacteria group bacterium]